MDAQAKTDCNSNGTKPVFYLDGDSLKTSELAELATGKYHVDLTKEAWSKVKLSRDVLDKILTTDQIVYGINTGFGKFANVLIPNEGLEELQTNLIRSHAAGVGKCLSTEHVRMLLALRINVLAKGFSGISVETLQSCIDAFNSSCLPCVPEKGTVGASGDLAPLSHIVLGLLGEGKMWSPKTGVAEADYVLSEYGLKPLYLRPKEGLALINGTQFITALGADAIEKSIKLALQADIISALTIEVLKGNVLAFHPAVHKPRPHVGQNEVAARLRAVLCSCTHPSELFEACTSVRKVQDPYTLRCIPQVHGVAIDTIKFAKNLIEVEMNSATDNPMVFGSTCEIISGGNFHGEYPAKALDYLAIGVQELANISERRTERLMNSAYNEGLPTFLVADAGINSGFMIAHCTAAALTSENKVLCHPSSSDTISTNSGTEDHVSMGGWSARKALKIICNVEYVLAIELLANCQALDFFHANKLKTTEPLEAVFDVVRRHVKVWNKDRYMAPDIEATVGLIRNNEIWLAVEKYVKDYAMVNDNNTKISCLLDE